MKKFYSALSQAVKLAEVEQGIPSNEWESTTNMQVWYDYIQKYLPLGKQVNIVDDFSGYIYPFNDGTGIIVYSSPCFNTSHKGYMIDVNGEKGPNKAGRDRFVFCVIVNSDNNTKNPVYGATSRLYYSSPTREELLQDCKTNPYQCSAFIMNDGWEIKSDYPYKL